MPSLYRYTDAAIVRTAELAEVQDIALPGLGLRSSNIFLNHRTNAREANPLPENSVFMPVRRLNRLGNPVIISKGFYTCPRLQPTAMY